MYALGFLAWEILCKKHNEPLHELQIDDDRNKLLDEVVNKGSRPKLSELEADTPPSLLRLLELCWSPERSARPTALEFYSTVEQCYNVLSDSSYDIFFSHPWVMKTVLNHAKRYLTSLGYKVWYDQNDMQWDIAQSMRDGVMKSKVVLACISKTYESSKNCMHELSCAYNLGNKPIVTLSTDADPFNWTPNMLHGDLKKMCGINGQGKMFVDIGNICSRPGWNETDEGMIPKKDIEDLHRELDKIVQLLRGSQINCQPKI
jgi:hypothetical protein